MLHPEVQPDSFLAEGDYEPLEDSLDGFSPGSWHSAEEVKSNDIGLC